MQEPQPHTQGVLATARFIASQNTAFRTYLRTLGAGFVAGVVLLTTIGANQLWSRYPASAQSLPVIDSQAISRLTPKMQAERLQIPADDPTPTPIVTAVAQPTAPIPAGPAGSLEEVIRRWQLAHPSVRLAVDVRELGVQERRAGYNSATQFYAASLYKLYVVGYLYERIEQGSLDQNSVASNGRSYAACIDAMILVSDNTCSEDIGNSVGWSKIQAYINAKGFTGTSVNNGGIRATAAGASEFMERLYAGQLMNGDHTAHFLDLMKNQVYRSAIPAAMPGVVVADKVGFYGGSWHDSGIVYGPKSTYILSILTTGAGPTQIKDLAVQIADFMNRS